MNRSIRAVLGTGFMSLGLALLFLFPHLALAHASLMESNPAANEVLSEPPASIQMTFSEHLQPAFLSVQVTGADGSRVDNGDAALSSDNAAVVQAGLRSGIPNGVYTITWRVLSADGHPIQGVIPFQIGAGGEHLGGEGAAAAAPSPLVRPDLIAVRWLFYAGLSLLFGMLCFRLYVWRGPNAGGSKGIEAGNNPRLQTLIWTGFAATAVAVLISLPLQVSWDAGVPVTRGFSPALIGEALQYTSAGKAWFVQIMILLLLSALLLYAFDRAQSERRRVLCAHASVSMVLGIMLAKAFTGHAAAATIPALAITADFVHLAAAAFWIGSLAAMILYLPSTTRELPTAEGERIRSEAMRRFAGWGMTAAASLLATGIYTALVHLPSPASLFITSYGYTLLGKTVLLIVMLAFAAYQFRLARRPSNRARNGTAIRWELTTGILVLLLAALLTHLSPTAGAETEVESDSFRQTAAAAAGNYEVELAVDPTRVGSSSFEVWIRDADGKSVTDIQQVTLTLIPAASDRRNQEVVIPGQSAQPFTAKELLATAGTWTVRVHALTGSLDSIDADFELPVAAP
ncbi:copper resistance protein CopC/CopD [Paenibacillus sp. P96]|uniref:Copper resistance protein CopC/CopD n=1 Tax=Paenibacillus zeirhizosphaerae TaxID=2987519 RepID=A0ABT9FMW7_9BACL|nr:copper resistance protein CopC [Paenibacillus sp. P96]MDP4096045.1 copper resistance protein CopC/CopD [Paenibacillus sp. P96]